MPTSQTGVSLSLPKARKVRGYSVDRMPIGRFLAATQLLQDAPEDILKRLVPEAKSGDALKRLASLNRDGLQALLLRAATVLPEYMTRVLAQLFGIEEEKLLNDPDIGLDGLMEMLDAWLDVNGIENFIKAAGALWDKVRKITTSAGSNA